MVLIHVPRASPFELSHCLIIYLREYVVANSESAKVCIILILILHMLIAKGAAVVVVVVVVVRKLPRLVSR